MASTLTAAADTLVVSECFGPTVQGEGPSSGCRCTFIRLGGCNLSCSWCDSAYTWNASRYDLRTEMTRRPVADLAAKVLADGTGMAVITGGEPLLHQDQPAFGWLLDTLHGAGVRIEIETNSTRTPTPHTAARVAQFNASPKLACAGDRQDDRIVPAALAALLATSKAVFKFVCTSPADLNEVAAIADLAGIPPALVWIMPEGADAITLAARLAQLADPAIAAGYNLTTRLHVLAWGNERGR